MNVQTWKNKLVIFQDNIEVDMMKKIRFPQRDAVSGSSLPAMLMECDSFIKGCDLVQT